MTEKIVTLQFDRSQDTRTDHYYIYRSTTPGVSRRSTRVMKIRQIPQPNPTAFREAPEKINATTYRLSHRNIIEDKPFIVYLNDYALEGVIYQLDRKRGIIVFEEAYSDAIVIEIEYHFDGITVNDDFESNTHLQLKYYGPPAQDKIKPDAPTNLSLVPTIDGNMAVHFQPVTHDGMTFYYVIEARSRSGSYSYLSKPLSVQVAEPIRGYLVETSTNDMTWFERGRVSGTPYMDRKADDEPPEELEDVAFTKKTVSGGTEIMITWRTPLLNLRPATTPKYRIRTMLDNDHWSEPSAVVGPGTVISPLEKIVILRKLGTEAPIYGDATAEKVADVYGYGSGQHIHVAPAGNTYTYSLFVLDKAGNASVVKALSITT